jgi:hypothetical protein
MDLLFGAKDSVIRPELARNLAPKAPSWVRTTVVNAGHQLLTEEVGTQILQLVNT